MSVLLLPCQCDSTLIGIHVHQDQIKAGFNDVMAQGFIEQQRIAMAVCQAKEIGLKSKRCVASIPDQIGCAHVNVHCIVRIDIFRAVPKLIFDIKGYDRHVCIELHLMGIGLFESDLKRNNRH